MNTGAQGKTVRVTIFHQEYSVTSAEGPEVIEGLAREVDHLMVSIAQQAGKIDSARIAVLACLHMADRLRSTEAELSALKAKVEERTRQYSALLDQAKPQKTS